MPTRSILYFFCLVSSALSATQPLTPEEQYAFLSHAIATASPEQQHEIFDRLATHAAHNETLRVLISESVVDQNHLAPIWTILGYTAGFSFLYLVITFIQDSHAEEFTKSNKTKKRRLERCVQTTQQHHALNEASHHLASLLKRRFASQAATEVA